MQQQPMARSAIRHMEILVGCNVEHDIYRCIQIIFISKFLATRLQQYALMVEYSYSFVDGWERRRAGPGGVSLIQTTIREGYYHRQNKIDFELELWLMSYRSPKFITKRLRGIAVGNMSSARLGWKQPTFQPRSQTWSPSISNWLLWNWKWKWCQCL